jgi:hypothetical protein
MVDEGNKLLYKSEGSFRSLWNSYRIYADRIELEFRFFFTTIIIRRNDFVHVDVFRPPVFRTSMCALKLDFADLCKHVGILRNCGYFKEIRFTPSDPAEFERQICLWAQT